MCKLGLDEALSATVRRGAFRGGVAICRLNASASPTLGTT